MAHGNAFTTCLWFDTQAEEAARFYTGVFPDSRMGAVLHYGDAGPGPKGSVMVAEFELNGQKFIGLNGGPDHRFTPAISFQIPCKDQEEVDYYWSRLGDGGEEVACGWVTDRYGLSWQVVPTVLLEMLGDADTEKATRANRAMLSMTKLDIAELRRAFEGEG